MKYDENIKNERNKNRKHTAQSLDTMMQGLTKPITEVCIFVCMYVCIYVCMYVCI